MGARACSAPSGFNPGEGRTGRTTTVDTVNPTSTEPTARDLVALLLDVPQWVAFDVDADGRVLAGSDESGSLQLVEIDQGGTRRQLTALPGKCSGRYVPGRRAIIVQHDTGGDERMQLSMLDLAGPVSLPAGPEDLAPVVADPAHLNDLRAVTATSLVYSTNRRNDVDMDVVVRDLATGAERTVYDAGGYVTASTLSHDETRVAVTLIGGLPSSSIVAVNDPERGVVTLTDPADHAMHTGVAWAAGDDSLVMASNHQREFMAIVRVPVDAGSPWQTILSDDAHDLFPWTAPDGSAIAVATMRDGLGQLTIHEPDGELRCEVDLLGSVGVPDVVWSADGSRFVVSLPGPTDPGSLYLVDAHSGAATRLVDARDGIDPAIRDRLVTPSTHLIPTADGELVPCFVYRAAPGSDPALQGSSVLHIHGGPEGAATRTFMPIIQALALSGITVLAPNVRGSTGYGKRWYSLDDVGLRLDSVADLAALHEHLPELDLDPARSALWGGSYGGYMVLAGVALQPDRWAAGVDIVGMSSLVTFLENTSPYRRAAREREYGSLERDRDVLVAASPITYLDAMRAPLFVIHGANDPRVPLSEAEQLVAAYAAKGIPCELRVYHDEGHGLAKRVNRLDAYPAAIEFLRTHLTAAE